MQDETPEKDARAVLWPRGQEREWNGKRYRVLPWSLELLVEFCDRIPEKMTELFAGETSAPAATVIPKALKEIRYIIARTLDIPEDEINGWCAEDILDAGIVVADVCLLPLKGKMLGLAQRVLNPTGAVLAAAPTIPRAGPSPAPSST